MKRKRGKKESEPVVDLTGLGDYVVRYLDELLAAGGRGARRLVRRVLRRGYVRLFGLRRDARGRTLMVDHLVVNGRGRIRHYGVHGVRGWDPTNPDLVQFRNARGEDMEWEEVGEVRVGPARREPRRVERWKRVKGG